eukprot:gnl/MRDRNA2_/MRDRNA2_56512_c0_seq1.p1 gnl/MRDRNA2_/MRDRNA2_56512_c0~~gnl/MRDRNA2_/MRDRNA2_56512_c0_seq1.p1  ORF type:complete len:309 (-),score=72.52 gnl/MRDRNA2_/MRDRNA2_56512_c0_seq1:63-989(-)
MLQDVSDQSLQEELKTLLDIYEDIFTVDEGSDLTLHAPVPYAEGSATFICKLPGAYPMEPIRPDAVSIEGVPHDVESTILAMLELQGLTGWSQAHDRLGDPILFDLISEVRTALAWQLSEEEMEELVSEAKEVAPQPEAEVDDQGTDNLDVVDEAADWQTYEKEKRAAAEASRRAKQSSAQHVQEPELTTNLAKITLTGNAAWKARLQAGETVSFRGGGNSLAPLIKSGECCTYAPVFKHEDVKVRDVVFCQVKGRFWGHMVKKKTLVNRGRDGEPDTYNYTISNIHGHENGDTTLDKIYGKVIAVSK